jgi:hypothetical protein
MKLLFSEQNSNCENHQFPYAVWAIPENGETPADIFNAGFLPSSRNLDRFYLCRQVRVNLAKLRPSAAEYWNHDAPRITRQSCLVSYLSSHHCHTFPPMS